MTAVIIASLTVGLIGAYLTRGITFYAVGTDNEKIVKAAAHAEGWGWPAGMHRFAGGKARMKEAAVLALALMQRIIRDKTTDYALVTLCVTANSISAILIYRIMTNYFNPAVGLVAAVLFMTSFWPQLIALWGGVVGVSQVFCLFAIYFVQLGWYFPAGAMLGLTLFSSASSRKYLPLMLGAFLWGLREKVIFSGGYDVFAVLLGAALAFGVFSVLMKRGIRTLIKAMYLEKTPAFLNRLTKSRKEKEFVCHLGYVNERAGSFLKMAAATVLYLIAGLMVAGDEGFFWAHFYLLIGVGTVVFGLNYPSIIENLKAYYSYSQYGKPVWRSRFYTYREYFGSIGRPIRDNMRGAGWPWLLRYFALMLPLPCLFFIMSLVSFALAPADLLASAVILLLGLSPILSGELTGGVQVGRSYYPGFLGLLLVIGFALARLDYPEIFWMILSLFLGINAVWNAWVFWSDIWPARMAITNLIRELRKRGIKEFYTYDTTFNDALVNALPPEIQNEIKIIKIDTLQDIKEGWVVVPGTSPKMLTMCDSPLARTREVDFKQDPLLDQLLGTRKIRELAAASFKTFGTSRFWVHENEVPSYRDLILKEIGEEDRFRSRAWLLKVEGALQ